MLIKVLLDDSEFIKFYNESILIEFEKNYLNYIDEDKFFFKTFFN